MKKLLSLLVFAALSLNSMAQVEYAFHGNKFWDNWYIGLNGGVGTVTTHQALLKNLNPNAGLRVGKLLTPYIGLAIEGNVFFSNKAQGVNITKNTAIKYHQLGLLTNIDLRNAFAGYYGEPRKFDIQAVVGFYWGHNYGENMIPVNNIEEYEFERTTVLKKNTLVNKLALDFCYNFGKKMEWTAYIEPSLNYVIAGTKDNIISHGVGEKLVEYNINSSFLQLNLGINYRFKTSNGSHNFAIVESCDQSEVDSLKQAVNELREMAQKKEEQTFTLNKEKDELDKALSDCEQARPEMTGRGSNEPQLPAVFYPVNKSVITAAQQPNVAIAAEVLKNHMEYNLVIKGYASPEGPHDNNNSLGMRRAKAVKDMLVNRYKINPGRITTEGCGETDELFPVFELNRVAMMILQKKAK